MKSTSPPFALLRAGITASFAALALLVSTFHVQAAYRPPDMEKKIFNTKDVKLGKFDRAGLVGALVSIARDFDKKEHDVELDTRSYALAIAGRLDKDNKKVKDTLEQLKSNGKSVGEDGVEKKRIAGRLYSGIRALIRKKDNKANQTCAAYCVSIALLFDPEGEKSDKLKEMKKDLEKAGFKASWKGLLKAAIRHNNSPFGGEEQKFEEVERPMPGGDATKFAKKQTRINGLVIRKLSSGRHMGAASSIMFTALRSEDTEGLLFKFDQKVGTMMAGSIEEVIKLMRVRYEDTDKVPSGYKIDIVFEDKYTLVDGPSAGTAFALAVDSLFSGEELDDKYACTGAITADGQTGPIGGVASKIRGAKNKGCTLVGIPVSNAKGVADYMLLNGIDQVLSIQVFTQKNF
ncbi:MAG: S16 family serine protease, partial [Akkermansiaceae bacterium]